MADRKRCCCNCGNNGRETDVFGNVGCFCAIDGHYIGYVEAFEGWCRRWKKDDTFDEELEES